MCPPNVPDGETFHKAKQTMLIVDDNEDMVNFISNNFKSKYNIPHSSDEHKTLEKLNGNEVTLIVSDWMMPPYGGVELCKAVRKDTNNQSYPVYHVYSQDRWWPRIWKVWTAQQGADSYIEKPSPMQYLKSKLRIKNMIQLRRLMPVRNSRTSQFEPIEHMSVSSKTILWTTTFLDQDEQDHRE